MAELILRGKYLYDDQTRKFTPDDNMKKILDKEKATLFILGGGELSLYFHYDPVEKKYWEIVEFENYDKELYSITKEEILEKCPGIDLTKMVKIK